MKGPLFLKRTHHPHHYWKTHQPTRVGCVSGDSGDSKMYDGRDGVRMRMSGHRDGDGLSSDDDDRNHAVCVCVCV